MTGLDPAVEAAAEALSLEQTGYWAFNGLAVQETYRSLAIKAVAAAAPLIRAQERAAVHAEIDAAADEWTAEAIARQRQNLSSERLCIFADAAEVLADRIAHKDHSAD